MGKQAPITPTDELDPELISLAKPRAKMGPLLAISVLILALYLISLLWTDFRYALSSRDPITFDDLVALEQAGPPENKLISVRALANRAYPAKVMGDKEAGYRVLPFVGYDTRLWLQVSATSFFAKVKYQERYEGRILPMKGRSYANNLNAYLAQVGSVPIYLEPIRVEATLPATITGQKASPEPASAITLVEKVAGVARLRMARTDRIKDADEAKTILLSQSIDIQSQENDDDPDLFVFLVKAPAGHEKLKTQMAKAGYFGLTCEPLMRTHEGEWEDLQFSSDHISLLGTSVPRKDIHSLALFSAPSVDPQALVLIQSEYPGDYWYVPILVALLALIAGFMCWALKNIIQQAKNN